MNKWLSVSLRVISILVILAIVILVPWKVVHVARNVTPNQVLLNTQYGNYGQVVLYLDSFNLGNMSLHSHIEYDAGPRFCPPGSGSPFPSMANVIILCSEPLPLSYYPNVPFLGTEGYVSAVYGGPRWTIDPQKLIDTIEVDIPLNGSETAFPFDSYHQTLHVVTYPPPEANFTQEELEQSELGVPVEFHIFEYIPGYKVTERPIFDTMLAITIERHWSVPTEVTIIWLGLTFTSFLVLVRAGKTRGNGEIWTIIVGVAALLIAIPAMRFALVPQDISSSWTALDIMLVVPSAISLLAVLVALGRVLITGIPKQ